MAPIALVTGATGAIGHAISRQLAVRDFEVVLLCRDRQRGEIAVRALQDATGNDRISHAPVDLSLRSSIAAFASRWDRPVQVLVNNAAIAPHQWTASAEGTELQFATNVLAYYRLTEALRARLIEAAPARVVNVASYWAGDLEIDDLEFRRRPYDQHRAYRQSKQANRMLTVAFAERLEPHGVTVNACHSGDVHSALSHALGFGGHETPDQGAATPVWLATDPALAHTSGRYFEHGREVPCPFAGDRAGIAALDVACRGYGV
jgi:retinol dehydrogenase-13